MRDKEAKKARLLIEFEKYCNQLGITFPPTLVFSIADFKTVSKHSTKYSTRSRMLGCCSLKEDVILVRVDDWSKGNRHIGDLITTLIHELIHYKWKSLTHSQFPRKMVQIDNGVVFKPNGRPLCLNTR